MFNKFAGALGALIVGACAHASPIVITQTFSDVLYYDYGIASGVAFGTHPTDDWIFTATVDSNATNLSAVTYSNCFTLTSLTLTQASLGLDHMAITNAPVLFFYPDRFGFSATIFGTMPWTVEVYAADHFVGAHSLAEDLALATQTPAVVDSYTSFGPQWDGFEFANGSHLYGWGYGAATTTVSTVPEPENLALMAGALALLFAGLRKRNASR